VSPGFSMLHPHTDCILAHKTFELRDHPHLEGCVQNVPTAPSETFGSPSDNAKK